MTKYIILHIYHTYVILLYSHHALRRLVWLPSERYFSAATAVRDDIILYMIPNHYLPEGLICVPVNTLLHQNNSYLSATLVKSYHTTWSSIALAAVWAHSKHAMI